ncbi:MAG: aldo/keto reductase [Saccharofermentanales bacterium]
MKNLVSKNILGRTGLEVSRVAYGGIISGKEQQNDSDRYVAYAIENGVNYFDVAPSYGDAQKILGHSLIPYRRDINLACKTSEFTREAGMAQFKESMELLHTDYFDVFQLHALTEMKQLDQAFASDGIMNFLDQAKKDGRIKNLGFSSHNEDVALKALEYYDFDTVLFPLTWSLNLSKNTGNRILTEAKSRNLGILSLKAMAHRHWKQDEPHHQPKCWYKPIDLDNAELLAAACNFALSLGIQTFLPPGDFQYFKFAVENFAQINDPANYERSKELLKAALSDDLDYIFASI